MGKYGVELEVAGRLGMFARPDTGATPTSYPVPPWSAAKAILESIAFFADGQAWFCPTKVEVCRRVGTRGGSVRYQRYTTNYGGPLRKATLFQKGLTPGGSSMQVFATVLIDVCYRIYAEVEGPPGSGSRNPRHHLQDLFQRRLKQGRCHRTPCLGWSEFTCEYWGPFRHGVTEVDDALNLMIPSMLLGMWSRATQGSLEPQFVQNVKIQQGRLEYVVPENGTNNEAEETPGA